MVEPIHEKIKQSLLVAGGLYYRLVLVVGQAGSGKTAALQRIADEIQSSVINVNLTLSSKLLELTSKQRSLRLPEILGEIAETNHALTVLDNLEVLFDSDLQQDPLRLLQGIARNRTVVASWSGKYENGKLSYAEAGHPECRNYDATDLLIVDMDSTTKADSLQNTPREAEKS